MKERCPNCGSMIIETLLYSIMTILQKNCVGCGKILRCANEEEKPEIFNKHGWIEIHKKTNKENKRPLTRDYKETIDARKLRDPEFKKLVEDENNKGKL